MTFWTGVLVGGVFGAMLGIVLMCVLIVAGTSDRNLGKLNRADKAQNSEG